MATPDSTTVGEEKRRPKRPCRPGKVLEKDSTDPLVPVAVAIVVALLGSMYDVNWELSGKSDTHTQTHRHTCVETP